uniref:Receptor-type tyrosine-protein phosphatase F n=1 Tax=Nothobranchius furzeri TaxID=105023 RepID=A0A8C6PLD9_NOTFU
LLVFNCECKLITAELILLQTVGMPSFVRSPDDQTGISGGVVSFVCQAMGEPRPRITWTKKGKKVSSQRFEVKEFDGGCGSVLRIQPLRTNRDEAIYECTATNSLAEVTATAKLNVLEEDQIPHGFPTIDMGPQLKVVERTTTATMLCAASGNPDPEIHWFKDMLPPVHARALQIENSNMSDEGKYECVAVNSAGTRFSSPANLYVRVRRVPPRFSIPPTNHEVMPGGSVNLTCVAVGSPMPFVKWVSGEVGLSQENHLPVGRNVLELTNIHQSANYTCVAMSDLGVIEATAQVTVKALPKMPHFLGVVETTATSVTLNWESGNAEPVSYYLVQYRPKLSDNGFQEVDGVASTRYSIGGLSPFSEYEFRVLAVNSIGRGPPSSVVETRTGEQAPSSAPLHVQARLLSSSNILVQWEPPEEPNGQIQGYRIYYSSEPSEQSSTWKIHNTDESRFTTISGLTPGLTYSLKMLGFTAVGDGPLSDVLQIKTQQGVPSQPSGFEAEAELDTRIMLSWLWPGQDPIISYELLYWEHRVTFNAAGSYAVDGLKPDTVYLFSLAARSERGLGLFTQPAEARTTQSMLGAPPRKVVAEALNSTAVKVTWTPPLFIKQQTGGYHVICSRLKNGEPHSQPLVVDISNLQAQEAVISGLLPETTYSLTVSAYTTKGSGALSKVKMVTTKGAVPGPPTMMISTMTGNTALIQWRPPKETVGEHVGYQLQFKRTDEESFTVKDFRKTDDHFTVTGLHKGAVYIFKLSAKNRAGTGEEYIKQISTPEDVPSSYPQNLSVVALTSTSTKMAWEPPPLAERNGNITKYVVMFRDINGQHNNSNSTRETQMTIQGLQPDTTYDIRVQAFTSKGGGSFSPSVQIKTMSTSMIAFTKNFGVKAVMKTSVLLTWDLPETYKSQVPLKILYNHQSVEVQGHLMRKLITQLQPDTDYSFILMSRGNGAGGLQQQVSIRTAPDLLIVKPTRYQLSEEEDRVMILLPQVPAEARVSQVSLNRWENPEDMDVLELMLEAEADSHLQRQSPDLPQSYIAAKLDSLPEIFALGDDKKYHGYYNRALPVQKLYRCFVLAELNDQESVSSHDDGVTSRAQEDPEMLWVMGPVLAVIIIIITSDALKEFQMFHMISPVLISLTSPGMKEHPPIFVSNLADHIERLKANSGLRFSQEYQSIDPGQQFTWENSIQEVNKPKNRYANVIAYDHSRIILTSVDGVPASTYINANYIDGYRKQNAYIATQGPLPETLCDFWRMVWEQRTCTIVMMTHLEEKSRIKCEQYWPSRGTETYGMIQVTILDTVELATYVMRTFTFYKNGSSEKREVLQFQFLGWPDHGVPEYPTTTLAFLQKVRACNPPDAGPIIVHCSAGVGRTGCFIVIDAMLERMKHEKSVDIYGHVTCMRAQRNYMVQTEDQYIFIHEALLEAATCGCTEVTTRNLYTHIQKLNQSAAGETLTPMAQEFKVRTCSNFKAQNMRFISANLPCNKFKNRLINILPFEFTRVCLKPIRGVEGSDYINASFINGYRHQGAYIATQGPLAETSEDFWRMLWEHNSTIVVMLTKLREMGREKCHQYWPAECSARYQYFVVDPMAEYNMPQYILREFKVTDARDGQSRTIRQFQFTDWPEQGVPKTGEAFIDFIGQVHKTKEQFGQDGPITVHCSAGVGRTGVFITLSIVLERMRHEGVVDVFQTVKILRTQRPAMVQTEDQYQLCYRAALEYLGSFDHYAT